MTLLEPASPAFTWPNRITEADFKGWVEERGHGFLQSWDEHYQPLIETHDPEQDPQKGGLCWLASGKVSTFTMRWPSTASCHRACLAPIVSWRTW